MRCTAVRISQNHLCRNTFHPDKASKPQKRRKYPTEPPKETEEGETLPEGETPQEESGIGDLDDVYGEDR